MVPGEGPQPAYGMIVGEAPSRADVAAGRPFQGKVGEILGIALQRVGLSRSNLYLTHVVKELTLDSLDRVRRPYDPEIAHGLATLTDEINATSPVAILALGSTAARSLEGADVLVFPAWHPGFLLYSGKLQDDDVVEEWLWSQIRPWAREVIEGAA